MLSTSTNNSVSHHCWGESKYRITRYESAMVTSHHNPLTQPYSFASAWRNITVPMLAHQCSAGAVQLLPWGAEPADWPRAMSPAATAVPSVVAAALLKRWLQGRSVLTKSTNFESSVDLTSYTRWIDVPWDIRADCQALCLHPGTLQLARIRPKSLPKLRQCVHLAVFEDTALP